MWTFLGNLFDTADFPARWRCGNWSDGHGWLHIASDFAIFAAYFAIPVLLVYFILRRRDVPFPPVFWLFAAFILSCGVTHLIEATIFWHPWYRLSGVVKLVTAAVSWATVLALIPSLPKALALPGLARVNAQLREEIARREKAEEERRQIERQMLQAQKLESMGVLAGGIAHDFNNLLTSILGFADLARAEVPAASPAAEYLDQVVGGAQRAAELTNQMLAYSGKGRLHVQQVRLNELVDGMARLLHVSIPKNCALVQEARPGVPPVEGDASQLRQVVMNLILNAADALNGPDGNGGTIRVRTDVRRCDAAFLAGTYLNDGLSAGTYTVLEVIDTGCGMTAETVKKIFDPFFTTKFTGRGLGLAAVLGVVRGHRGAIEVESVPGAGTTFRVYFPAATDAETGPAARSGPASAPSPAPTPAPTGPPAPSPARDPMRGTVLVADDEESVRRLAADMLAVLGFAVATAADGLGAVAAVEREPHRFRLVLLDLSMPGVDGIEARRRIAAVRPELPVVLTSGYSERETRSRVGADAGPVGFLQKPYQLDSLRAAVAEALGLTPA